MPDPQPPFSRPTDHGCTVNHVLKTAHSFSRRSIGLSRPEILNITATHQILSTLPFNNTRLPSAVEGRPRPRSADVKTTSSVLLSMAVQPGKVWTNVEVVGC
jgi:hypothetical protein